jgi:hypothetical protein
VLSPYPILGREREVSYSFAGRGGAEPRIVNSGYEIVDIRIKKDGESGMYSKSPFLGARGKSLTALLAEGALSPSIGLKIKFELQSPAVVARIEAEIIFSIDKKSFSQIDFTVGRYS